LKLVESCGKPASLSCLASPYSMPPAYHSRGYQFTSYLLPLLLRQPVLFKETS
jgi:hypothetical protein